ncbi:MAG: tRNA (adenosine(37)-N6)-threonylcarbamoyltransferase complex ATPase subunit type 1 TsaE [Flavobacteriales bacterium]
MTEVVVKYKACSLDEMEKVVSTFATVFPEPVVVLMDAAMGCGKTTFVNAFAKMKGVDESSSPTFALVNEYKGNEGCEILHFDLYRLNDQRELMDIGFDEYLDRSAYIFIEWPELARPWINFPHVELTIEMNDQCREIQWKYVQA